MFNLPSVDNSGKSEATLTIKLILKHKGISFWPERQIYGERVRVCTSELNCCRDTGAA